MILLHSMKVNLNELIANEVISQEVANNIKKFYTRDSLSFFKLINIISSFLILCGIALLIAFNWHYFSNNIKFSLAFIILFISQILCYCVIYKKINPKWSEYFSLIWFFSIGIALFIIAQVYNLSSSVENYLLTWLVLSIGIIYSMQSKVCVILFLVIAGIYSTFNNFYYNLFDIFYINNYTIYLLLLLSMVYFIYINVIKFTSYLNSLVILVFAISVIIYTFFTFFDDVDLLKVSTLLSIVAIFITVDKLKIIHLSSTKTIQRLSTFISYTILIIFSMNALWANSQSTLLPFSLNFLISYLLALIVILICIKRYSFKLVNTEMLIFFIFTKIIILNELMYYFDIAQNLRVWTIVGIITCLVLFMAIRKIYISLNTKDYYALNVSLFSIFTLTILRLFYNDNNLLIKSFIFILLGLTFVGLNYYMKKIPNEK